MIWIDVSDLIAWSGHMTGIQRLVYNVASAYQQDDPTVSFFYYDAHSRTFHKTDIDFATWLEARTAESAQQGRDVKALLRRYVPASVQRRTPVIAKRAAKKALRLANERRRTLKTKLKSSSGQTTDMQFSAGDTVLVLGNAWNNQKLFEDLGRKKMEEHFKLVNVVYDLIPVLQPQFFGNLLSGQYADYLFEAVTNCDLMLPISKSSDRDLQTFCKHISAPMPQTEVIRLGDELSDTKPEACSWYKGQNFILCVGTVEVRKNHALLYYAYKQMLRDGKTELPEVVIVGSNGWYTDDIRMLLTQDPEIAPFVRFMKATEEELAWLYKNALFTIYPSMYEGWGLPVAESLAYGKVSLTSDASSMPEAGGELADYFSPYDARACADLILRYLDSNTRAAREEQIKNQYKITSWQETYQQVKQAVAKL